MSKYMLKVEQILVREGLKPKTAEDYVKNLYRLNGDEPFKSLTFLRKVDTVMTRLKERKLKPSTMEMYVAMTISVLEKFPSKFNNKAKDEYKKLLEEPNDYFVLRDRSKKTENQEKNWISKDEFDKYIEEAKQKGEQSAKKTKHITTADYNNILNWFIISFYTLLPPRRNKDLMLMKINSKEGNSLDTKDMVMTFRDYKTSKTYGEQSIELNEYPEFVKVLNIYLKHRNGELNDYLLTHHNGDNFKQVNSLTRQINKIFGRHKVSTTAIRSMYLTNKYGGKQNEDMIKDSTVMAHSITQQQTSYIKK